MLNFSLTKRYIPAITLLVVFIIFSHVLINNMVNANKEFAKIINISGKQRMLSQRLIILAQDYYEDNLKKSAFKNALDEIKASHKYLMTKITTKELKRIYFDRSLDTDLRNYLKHFDNLLVLNNPLFIKLARDSSKAILKKLDSAVKEYERYSEEKLNDASELEFNLMIATLFILMLEVLFIFYPASKRIDENTKELVQKAIYEKEQAKIIIQQSKMASMGEIIENIAHQWRQPLSIISTAASGIQIEKEYGILKDKVLNKRLQNIIDHTESLSQTIEDFRSFFKSSKDKESFEVNKLLVKTQSIVDSVFEYNDIKIIQNFDKNKDIYCVGFKNELSQVIINIITNAKDIMLEKEIKDKVIKIDLIVENNNINIKIFDSAGGIDDDILPKIFDPYFTTKHKSQGIGLGLYMSSEIINNHFNGYLKATNQEFKVDDKKYYGACFNITIPTKVQKDVINEV